MVPAAILDPRAGNAEIRKRGADAFEQVAFYACFRGLGRQSVLALCFWKGRTSKTS